MIFVVLSSQLADTNNLNLEFILIWWVNFNLKFIAFMNGEEIC